MKQTWIDPRTTLEGTLVRLIPMELAHAPGLLAAASPELFRYTPQGPASWTVEGFEENIRAVMSLDDVVPFTIIHKHTGKVIGRSTYMAIRAPHKSVEVGRTWIARQYQGTRVNPEIKLLMFQHAFESLGAIRVELLTGGRNVHSQAAISKLGAVKEGVMRDHRFEPDGNIRDTVIYSILKREWPTVKGGLLKRLESLAMV
jgi:RimJ/RimL family protein N-acetyltransferase